jgi:CheY-like chemotaxis protein
MARAKAPPEITRALDIIERNARAQTRIVEDVLDVSRIGAGTLKLVFAETSLGAVMERAVESVKPAADAKGIELAPAVEDGVSLHADGERLLQIVGNLLSNAIKFSPTGARVDLIARRIGRRVEIVVEDRGDGIPLEFLPHVFEAFRQADSSHARRHGGLGLGLSIARQLTRAHGGELVASSAGRGQGATFTITLPLTRESLAEERAPEPRASEAPRYGLHGLHVLVVDDDEDARVLLETVLEEHGARATTAGSAGEGLDVIVRTRPDLLISDIAMPDRDGYDLIQAMRALPEDGGGETPAIALTAHARPSDSQRVLAAGFQAYLSKPMDIEELVTTIANVCPSLSAGDRAPEEGSSKRHRGTSCGRSPSAGPRAGR